MSGYGGSLGRAGNGPAARRGGPAGAVAVAWLVHGCRAEAGFGGGRGGGRCTVPVAGRGRFGGRGLVRAGGDAGCWGARRRGDGCRSRAAAAGRRAGGALAGDHGGAARRGRGGAGAPTWSTVGHHRAAVVGAGPQDRCGPDRGRGLGGGGTAAAGGLGPM